MKLKVLKPGLLTSIQDLGRDQYLSQAVPISGAVDRLSHRLANLALGNDENAATIEFTYGGATLKAETDLLVAFSGEGAAMRVEKQRLPQNKPLFIPKNTTINLEKSDKGCRTYLSIAGGFDVPDVLNSKSTYLIAEFGGLNGRCLQNDDVLENKQPLNTINQIILNSLNEHSVINSPKWSIAKSLFQAGSSGTIRVVPGKEFTWFTAESLLNFMSETFVVSPRNNRMAYVLDGHKMTRTSDVEMLSTAVTIGTIQVTGDGKLMLLMADCQSTGGYPRIAQVAAVDLSLCAQLKPGDEFNFELINRRQAEKLYLQQELDLQQLKASIKEKFLK